MPVINMLKGLLEKVDIIKDQMGNFSKEMEAVRKNKRNVIHTHTHRELKRKNSFNRFICRLTKKRISELNRQIQTYNWRLKHSFLSN